MRDVIGVRGGVKLLGIVAVLLVCLAAFSITAKAQNPGNNAVYNANKTVVGSAAFIDASVFASIANPNICAILKNILNGTLLVNQGGYPATGAIIDARGLNPTNTSMTCTASPWAGITNPPPSTILLPATGALPPNTSNPIVIPTPWILPPNTHLIGEGDGIPIFSSNDALISAPATTIQAKNGFTDSSMIEFGSSSVCPNPSKACTGISVENLTLDGQGQSINGITNGFSQDQTYMNHVSLYQIRGVGLLIEQGGPPGNATNSGPYSNITFDTGSFQGTGSTVCAQILNAGSTHGIHGLSCAAETTDAPAAVLLDSSNNSIEDVRIVGFYDGISVGKNAPAQSNVLFNIIGDTGKGNGASPVRVGSQFRGRRYGPGGLAREAALTLTPLPHRGWATI
jgi:hypothetical protein